MSTTAYLSLIIRTTPTVVHVIVGMIVQESTRYFWMLQLNELFKLLSIKDEMWLIRNCIGGLDFKGDLRGDKQIIGKWRICCQDSGEGELGIADQERCGDGVVEC